MYFFPLNRHNAYQKAMVLINSSDVNGNRRIFVPESGWWRAYTSEHTQGWYFSYESLFDLYTTGKYYWEGYIDDNGFSHYAQNGPGYFSQANRDKYVWEILGRAAHLLTDMSVPAHGRLKSHPCDIGKGSRIEMEAGGKFWSAAGSSCNSNPGTFPAQNWTYQNANSQGGILTPWSESDPLYYLFYTTAQITDVYSCQI